MEKRFEIRIYKSMFQREGTETAEIRETVKRLSHKYNEDNNPFAGLLFSDFTENRVIFIDVPEGTSIEDVQKKLEGFPQARIQKTLSFKPILTLALEKAIENGLITLDQIAEKQLVKNNNDEVILFKGKPQYRYLQLSLKGRADVDLRDNEDEAYIPKALRVKS